MSKLTLDVQRGAQVQSLRRWANVLSTPRDITEDRDSSAMQSHSLRASSLSVSCEVAHSLGTELSAVACMSLQHREVLCPLTHHVCELGPHDGGEACLVLFSGCNCEPIHCWGSSGTLFIDAHGFSVRTRAEVAGHAAGTLASCHAVVHSGPSGHQTRNLGMQDRYNTMAAAVVSQMALNVNHVCTYSVRMKLSACYYTG